MPKKKKKKKWLRSRKEGEHGPGKRDVIGAIPIRGKKGLERSAQLAVTSSHQKSKGGKGPAWWGQRSKEEDRISISRRKKIKGWRCQVFQSREKTIFFKKGGRGTLEKKGVEHIKQRKGSVLPTPHDRSSRKEGRSIQSDGSTLPIFKGLNVWLSKGKQPKIIEQVFLVGEKKGGHCDRENENGFSPLQKKKRGVVDRRHEQVSHVFLLRVGGKKERNQEGRERGRSRR